MATPSEPQPKLTRRQRLFIDEYLQCWNGAEAARRAGYGVKNARITAAQLLTTPNISGHIEARLSEVHMSADEALKLTADIARGDIAELMEIRATGFDLDLNEAKKRGLTKLIRRVRQKTTTFISKKPDEEDREITETEIELYDAQAAQRDVLKLAGRFIERHDLTTGGQPLKVIIEYGPGDPDDNGNTPPTA